MNNEQDEITTSIGHGWRVATWVCSGVIVISVLACVTIAFNRSTGLVGITVTALDKAAEPKDHNIPFIKQTEALPDYQISVIKTDKERLHLGSKPNTSAVNGLAWLLPDPVSTSDIASILLEDQDKIDSDKLAEVQPLSESVTSGNYRFEFKTERSFSVGVQSFFKTPIGIAISTGFTIAILLLIARFLPIF